MQQPSKRSWLRSLREVRQELANVTWPTRKEVITYSIVVLVTVVVLGLFVLGLDTLLSRLIIELFAS